MRRVIEMKLEQILLSEANGFQNLMFDVRTYEQLQRISVNSPELISTEELEVAKEAILEKWPTITDLEAALDSTGMSRGTNIRRLITEGKQLPRVRPEPRVRETPDQRAARLEQKKANLKAKVQEKKNKPK